MVNIADEVTGFPNDGDDKKISLRNSKFKQFDYSFAERIKEEHNDIFNAGGNEYGDTAFNNWGKVRGGEMTDTLEEWIVRRERFMERHEKDKRLAGVVAVMKWGGIVSRGQSYMKDLINEEIDKQSDKSDKGGEQVEGKEKKLVDISEFKSRLDKDKSTDDIAVRKQFDVEVKEMDEDKRVLRFIASTSARDRDGDIINPKGWELDDFIKNPVFLWAHDYSVAPLGKIVNYEMSDEALIEDVEFINPKEMYPDVDYKELPEHVKFADMVYRMYKNGTLNAVSVGFNPIDYKYSNDKEGNVDFIKQSQLELSAVPVPSNQEALRVAGMKGADKGLMTKWAKSVLKGYDEEEEEKEEEKIGVCANCGTPREMKEDGTECPNCGYKEVIPADDYEEDGYMEDEEKNKSVNQSSAMDDFFNEIKELTKAGRTLSSANERRLRQAKEMLDEVLDQLEEEKSLEDDFVIELEEKEASDYLELEEDNLIEIDQKDLEEAAKKTITSLTGRIF